MVLMIGINYVGYGYEFDCKLDGWQINLIKHQIPVFLILIKKPLIKRLLLI